jgi:NAD-dependent deacetylase
MSPDKSSLQIATWLAEARHVAVLTGAGMSAESGISTFRDSDGLWSRFDPMKLATWEAFVADRTAVWAWYRARREQLKRVTPHRGHELLAEWRSRVLRFDLITQNVDGLHDRAGFESAIELHGRLDQVRCTGCTHSEQHLEDLGPDPACLRCGRPMRPGVVWFGESLPMENYDRALTAARLCDIFLVIGTSGVVEPAASLATMALAHGAIVVEINPSETPISRIASASVRGLCGPTLAAIDEAWQSLGRER